MNTGLKCAIFLFLLGLLWFGAGLYLRHLFGVMPTKIILQCFGSFALVGLACALTYAAMGLRWTLAGLATITLFVVALSV